MNDNSPSPNVKRKWGFCCLVTLLSATLFLNNLLFLTNSHATEATDSNAIKTDVAMPPSLALITVALGPIRGLIVDALWWKVVDLQEASNYFEILPITEWITAMEPENPYVWTFHAWNLAYNIAGTFPTVDTRWKWIYNGIKLLRDDAREFNPNSKFIQSELGLLISDKISSMSDPRRDYLIEQWIKTKEPYLNTGLRDDLRNLISASTPEYKRQAESLRRNTGMVPEKMLRIDMEYGPLQWKLPQAAAIYWGARENQKDYKQGDMNYGGVITSSMIQSFLFGSYVTNPKENIYATTNDLEITANIVKLLKCEIREKKSNGTLARQAKSQLNDFIAYAAPISYAFDRPDIAAMLYREQQSSHPKSTLSYDKFISGNLIKLTTSAIPRLHQSLIEISLYNAYKALAKNEPVSAARFAKAAKKRWDNHMRDFGGAGSRFTIPPFKDIKTAAYARTLRFLKSEKAKAVFKKRISNLKNGLLTLPNNTSIQDFSVASARKR